MIKISFLQKTLLTLALALLTPLATAADRSLQCTVGNLGTAQIEVLAVEKHPELRVLKISMQTKLVRNLEWNNPSKGVAYISGLLTAQIGPDASVFASGMIHSESGGDQIQAALATLQGKLLDDGSLILNLQDADRVIQHGFGINLECR